MKKNFKCIAALLLAVMLMSAFASCASDDSGGTNNAAETTSAADTEAAVTQRSNNLPDTDWDGREYRVLGYLDSRPQFCTFGIYAESMNGDVVNDAVYERNSEIETKYNVKIVEEHCGSLTESIQSTAPHIRTTVQAGEDLYDLGFDLLLSIGAPAKEGMYIDLNTVEYLDFTQDWWNAAQNETISFYDKLYFAASDYNLRDKSRTMIFVYNKDMAEEYGHGNIIELINDGTWTFDKLTAMAKDVSSDANGNGEVDDQDIFGFALDSYNSCVGLVTACDNQAIIKNSNGDPELNMNTERAVKTIDTLIDLVADPAVAAVCNDWNGKVDYDYWSVSSKLFYGGRALFITSYPHSLSAFSANCEDDYGIITFPKLDEQQEEYYTLANSYAMLFFIPVTCADTEFAGFILEALSEASTDTTLNAYYEVSCKTKYTYDEVSAEMLDLTFDNIRFDIPTLYSINSVKSIYNSVIKSKTNTFSSTYAAAEKAALTELEALIGILSE